MTEIASVEVDESPAAAAEPAAGQDGPSAPKVTIGLPVYNGEKYLPVAIESILTQDFADFEIVISDNASTDATEQIGRAAAADDPRVRYIRQPVNLGMSRNYHAVLAAARGQYFRWAAADDEVTAGYLAGCVAALDADPDVALAHAQVVDMDENGVITHEHPPLDVDNPDPVRRLRALLGVHESSDHYGLIRTEVLRSLPPLGSHPEPDRVILVGLGLRGRIVHAPGEQFRRRVHSTQTSGPGHRTSAKVRIHDPRRSGLGLPAFELGRDLLREIHNAPLTRRQKRACYLAMWGWFRLNYMKMARNVARLVIELAETAGRGLGRLFRRPGKAAAKAGA